MGYSIGQFSKLTQLSIDTLRYYEKESLIIVNRDALGRRYYTDADLQWVFFIKRLKETGMPLKVIREYALLRYEGDSTLEPRLKILEQHQLFVRSEIKKWKSHLDNLTDKIDIYKNQLKNDAT